MRRHSQKSAGTQFRWTEPQHIKARQASYVYESEEQTATKYHSFNDNIKCKLLADDSNNTDMYNS